MQRQETVGANAANSSLTVSPEVVSADGMSAALLTPAGATIVKATPGACIILGASLVGGAFVPFAQTATIRFVAPDVAPPPGVGVGVAKTLLRLTAESREAVADAVAPLTVHVSVSNAQGTAIMGRSVAVMAMGGQNALSTLLAPLGETAPRQLS